MRLLLDTHIVLWWLEDNEKLTESARTLIADADMVFVSSASVWEAAIKAGIGKLDVDIDQLVEEIGNSGFVDLPVTARHAAALRKLADIHRDPFDRIMIAQALCEPLRFLTADGILKGYSDLVELI